MLVQEARYLPQVISFAHAANQSRAIYAYRHNRCYQDTLENVRLIPRNATYGVEISHMVVEHTRVWMGCNQVRLPQGILLSTVSKVDRKIVMLAAGRKDSGSKCQHREYQNSLEPPQLRNESWALP